MKSLFTFLIVVFAIIPLTANSQTKKEAEDWMVYYLNKYYTSSFRSDYQETSRKYKLSPYTFYTYKYEFINDKLVVNTQTFIDTIGGPKSIYWRYDSIDLRRVIKVEKEVSEGTYNSYNSYYVNLVFEDLKYDEYGITNNPVIEYDPMKNKVTKSNIYKRVYQLLTYDDEVKEKDLIGRMLKAMEFIVNHSGGKIIKEVF